jgi:hypothetical protein
MRIFLDLIEKGELRDAEALSSFYKRLLKAYHPDLAGPGAKGLDFDDIRKAYAEARAFLDAREAPSTCGVDGGLDAPVSYEAFVDAFRDVAARGLPASEALARRNPFHMRDIETMRRFLALAGYDFESLNALFERLKYHYPLYFFHFHELLWFLFDFEAGGPPEFLDKARSKLAFLSSALKADAKIAPLFEFLGELVEGRLAGRG